MNKVSARSVPQMLWDDDEDVVYAKNGRLEEQDQQFFYSGIPALDKSGTKCISVAGDYVEK